MKRRTFSVREPVPTSDNPPHHGASTTRHRHQVRRTREGSDGQARAFGQAVSRAMKPWRWRRTRSCSGRSSPWFSSQRGSAYGFWIMARPRASRCRTMKTVTMATADAVYAASSWEQRRGLQCHQPEQLPVSLVGRTGDGSAITPRQPSAARRRRNPVVTLNVPQ